MDGDSTEGKWNFPPARFRWALRLKKIRRPGADDSCLAVRLEKNCGAFFDSDGANLLRPTVLQNTRHKYDEAAHAVALGEVGVGDNAGEKRDAQEVSRERDFVPVGISKRARRVDRVNHRRK